jgi:hypothetical protein
MVTRPHTVARSNKPGLPPGSSLTCAWIAGAYLKNTTNTLVNRCCLALWLGRRELSGRAMPRSC